jgi:cytochrome c biogenesis protein CcmG/thiol:disulfide interchange protein DsbE
MKRLARRWIATHLLANGAAVRLVGVRRPARPVAPPRAGHPRIGQLLSIGTLATALALGGCGSSPSGDYGGGHPDYARALAGSPAPLAALHRQGDRLLAGGVAAYEGRLAALRGYPVVVNAWASWCGPCRFEFPLFQRIAARYGRRVAFLGVNSQDSNDAARTFLREDPAPYPSYVDPDGEIAESVGAGLGLPDTVFYDRRGRLVHLKQGPYANAAELRADLDRYAIGAAAPGLEGG